MANYIITVRRPVITEEERQRRFEEFKRATATFLEAVERNRHGKENEVKEIN